MFKQGFLLHPPISLIRCFLFLESGVTNSGRWGKDSGTADDPIGNAKMLATIRVCCRADAASDLVPVAASPYPRTVTSVSLVGEDDDS